MAIFTNQATLSYNDTVTTSNVAVGRLVEVLSATKTAVVKSYSAPGDRVTYIINIINSGSRDISGLTLTDDLGAYEFRGETLYPLAYTENSVTYFIDGVPQPDPEVTDTNPLTVTGISVPAGGNTVIAYEAEVTRFAPLGKKARIKNTVEFTCAGVSPFCAKERVYFECGTVLSINKTISPSTVTENSRVTYSFDILNSGSEKAGDDLGIVLSDTFNPKLSDLVVTMNGRTLTAGEDYNYNRATGLFTTVKGVITVPDADYRRDDETGAWETKPGRTVFTITGTI